MCPVRMRCVCVCPWQKKGLTALAFLALAIGHPPEPTAVQRQDRSYQPMRMQK